MNAAACRGRHHTWSVNPPVTGTRCVKCGRAFTKDPTKNQGSPLLSGPKSTDPDNATAAPVLQTPRPAVAGNPNDTARMDRLRAALARGAAPAVETGAAAPVDAAKPPPQGWTKLAGRRLATMFVGATEEWCASRTPARVAKEPDDDVVDEFADSLAETLAEWFPNTVLSGWKRALIASAALAGGMCIGAPLAKPQNALSPSPPAPSTPKPAPAPAPRAVSPPPPAQSQAEVIPPTRAPDAATPMSPVGNNTTGPSASLYSGNQHGGIVGGQGS